jgi:hypothetical protein
MTIFVLARGTATAACVVDPTQTSPYFPSYMSVNQALADPACSAPGSLIEIWCPAGGCTDSKVVVNGLSDITIRSMELTVGAGAVTFSGVGPDPALEVQSATGIVIEGISVFTAAQRAVGVLDSTVTFIGLGALATPRYGQVLGGLTGMVVAGFSSVDLSWMGFTGALTGLRLDSPGGVPPSVHATGVAFQDNELAVDVIGPPLGCPPPGGTALPALLEIRSDFDVAWLNYVMHNVEGFHLSGRADLRIDHTVLATNLYQMAAGGFNPLLFSVSDSSRLEARNILAYDNDMTPAFTGPYAGGVNTAGYILLHQSCDESIFRASTVVNNAADIVFGVDGSGRVTLDHTLAAGNWGKVLSMSSWYVAHGFTCPPVSAIAANFKGNRINADPAACLPPAPMLNTTWNPRVTLPPLPPPRYLFTYPDIPAPRTDLYFIRKRSPLPTPLPPDLYLGRQWTVDGIHPDTNKLDVGYHNPF